MLSSISTQKYALLTLLCRNLNFGPKFNLWTKFLNSVYYRIYHPYQSLFIYFCYFLFTIIFDLFFKGVRLNAVDKQKLKDNYRNNERLKNNGGWLKKNAGQQGKMVSGLPNMVVFTYLT